MDKHLMKGTFLTFLLSFMSLISFAQSMEDTMRSHNKIYVVLAVCLVILIVMLAYLVRIDIKISKKEKNI